MDVFEKVGAVIIGRNEGKRLETCLKSAIQDCWPCVYVDSGSTDDSIAIARKLGVDVIEVDPTDGFGAARARNIGFDRIKELAPVTFVQFLDGDTELRQGWINFGRTMLEASPNICCISGRRRERSPEKSVYNRIVEWEQPEQSNMTSFAGDAMVRVTSFTEVEGFDVALIAGEEAELCQRLRNAGGMTLFVDFDMTWHDLEMQNFGQWWRRAYRGGFAFAQDTWRNGLDPNGGIKSLIRSLSWGLFLPLFILGCVILGHPSALLLLGLYPLQVLRMAIRHNVVSRLSWERSFFLQLCKFPESLGILRYIYMRSLRRSQSLIEYKQA